MESFTLVKILVETRDLAKELAKEKGMTLYGYLKMLVENDAKNNEDK